MLLKNYENDLQSMVDQQKKQVDKAEEQQHVDIKVSSDLTVFVRTCLTLLDYQFITNLL